MRNAPWKGFILGLVCLLGSVAGYAQGKDGLVKSGEGILPESSGWKLVWSDEFETDGSPTAGKWMCEEYGPYMYNSELQAYTSRDENAYVKNGILSIEARKDGGDGFDITSARITTDSEVLVQYGRIEFRARLPKGNGTWPALWMLPANPSGHGHTWPDSGEIDVMESVGFEGNVVHGSLHTAHFNHVMKTQITATKSVGDIGDWHVYAVEWYPDHITFFVDNQSYLTFKKPSDDWRDWPFDKPFYLIMNVAIGGTWGGMKGVDNRIFPAKMDVDYVRIYQNPSVTGSLLTVK